MGYPEALVRNDIAIILMNATSQYDTEAEKMYEKEQKKSGDWEEL